MTVGLGINAAASIAIVRLALISTMPKKINARLFAVYQQMSIALR